MSSQVIHIINLKLQVVMQISKCPRLTAMLHTTEPLVSKYFNILREEGIAATNPSKMPCTGAPKLIWEGILGCSITTDNMTLFHLNPIYRPDKTSFSCKEALAGGNTVHTNSVNLNCIERPVSTDIPATVQVKGLGYWDCRAMLNNHSCHVLRKFIPFSKRDAYNNLNNGDFGLAMNGQFVTVHVAQNRGPACVWEQQDDCWSSETNFLECATMASHSVRRESFLSTLLMIDIKMETLGSIDLMIELLAFSESKCLVLWVLGLHQIDKFLIYQLDHLLHHQSQQNEPALLQLGGDGQATLHDAGGGHSHHREGEFLDPLHRLTHEHICCHVSSPKDRLAHRQADPACVWVHQEKM